MYFRGLPSSDPDQRLESLVSLSCLGEPPRALFREQHSQPKDSAWHELEAYRNLPLGCGRLHVLVHGIVDPVRCHDAQSEKELEEATQNTADALRRHLG